MQPFKLHKIALGTLTALMLTPAAAQEVTLASANQATEANTQFILTYKQTGNATGDMLSDVATQNLSDEQIDVQQHVEETLSVLAGSELDYVRASAVNGRHIVRAERRLSEKEKADMIKALKNDPSVGEVEEDRLLQIAATPNDTQYANTLS